MKSVFFMPVYNQINEFPRVLDELKSTHLACDTLLLVNNGSNDGSEKLIRKSGFPYLDLQKNLGVGYSHILAIDWALERGYEIFGGLASNGKMLPSEMHRVLEPIVKNEADYVTGSRFLPGGESPNLTLFRQSTIPMVNIFVRWVVREKLTDATCGYRAMRLEIMKRACFDWHAAWLFTYEFEYYLYAKVLLDKKIRWKEVPITMRYPGQGKRFTKIRPFVGWWAMIKPWLIARFDGASFVA